MKKLSLLLLTFLLFSCYSTQLVWKNYSTKNFELNEIIKANVGNSMIDISNYKSAEPEDSTKQLTAIQNSFRVHQKEGFSQELTYSGIANNIINLTYREYEIKGQSKIIRDSFTEKLQYDLSLDKKITFRSLYIEVINANSNFIEFKVTEWKN